VQTWSIVLLFKFSTIDSVVLPSPPDLKPNKLDMLGTTFLTRT